ncbi:MAG: CapA family protein [bacterium]
MPASADIKVVAVGDVMLGSWYPSPRLLPESKMREAVRGVKSHMPKADISILNLEGVLIDSGKPAKKEGKSYHFAMPSRYRKYIEEMGFNVASLSNNHIMDFGWEGFINTTRVLESQGLKYAGLNGKIAEFSVGDKKVCVVAFDFSTAEKSFSILNIAMAKRVIAKLKKEHDIVIVSFHGGREGYERTENKMERFLKEERGNLVAFSRAVIDAGANLVIGHGPHLPRAMELYRGKLIAYSLGNFFTYGRFDIKGACGYAPMLYVVLDEKGDFKEGRIIPFKQIAGGVPVFDKEGKAISWILRLTKLDFPNTPLTIERNGVVRKQEPKSYKPLSQPLPQRDNGSRIDHSLRIPQG